MTEIHNNVEKRDTKETNSEAESARSAFVDEYNKAPKMSEKQLETSATAVYENLANAFNTGEPMNLSDSHDQFQLAFRSGKLNDLVAKVNEKIWSPDGIGHYNLEIENGKNADIKQVLLISNHRGELRSSDTVKMEDWEDNKNPIDKALDNCIGKAMDPSEEIGCTESAFEAWDNELNNVYGKLMKALPGKSSDASGAKHDLLVSQRNWLKHRDAELDFVDDIYNSKQGSMYAPMQSYARQDVIKGRVIQLHKRLDLVNTD